MTAIARTFPIVPRTFITISLIFGVVASFGLYVFFIERAVLSTAARTRLERQVSLVATEVGELEARYIAAENAVTMSVAGEYGLEEVSSTEFIAKKALGSVLSFNNEI